MNKISPKTLRAVAFAILMCLMAPPVLAAETPPKLKQPEMYERRELFPHSFTMLIGYHAYFSQDLEKDGRKPRPGLLPGEAEFEYVLDDDFSKVEMASTSYSLEYGYRFHNNFRLAGRLGLFHQKREYNGDLSGFSTTNKYRITGIHVDVSARLILPISSVIDFFLGAGPDVTYVIKEFQIRGVVESGDDTDGYDIYHEYSGFAPGAHAEAGIDVRLRDNWSMIAEYRPSYAISNTDDGRLNVGGHFAYLGGVYHF